MKKYMRNLSIVEAFQYDGTSKSIEEIKELFKETSVVIEAKKGERGRRFFNLVDHVKRYTVHKGEWIVKDSGYYFIISDDIFQEFFTEIAR